MKKQSVEKNKAGKVHAPDPAFCVQSHLQQYIRVLAWMPYLSGRDLAGEQAQ
jgi:hypothetical protein